jgi:pyrroline-5-carboxylate reductase
MKNIAILGAGNIGIALAKGLVKSQKYQPQHITLTKRNVKELKPLQELGFNISDNNIEAVKGAEIVVISVLPQQLNYLLNQIKDAVSPSGHLIISVVSGVAVKDFKAKLSAEVSVVRAMPNTAIAINESMTCIQPR